MNTTTRHDFRHDARQVQTLINNCRKLGKESQHVALAAHFVGISGVRSLCCWCSEHIEGKATRLPRGGECEGCSYVGHDCLVIETRVTA